MPPETHATLSASSAHRWLHCTPSALLEAHKPDRDTEVSREGTAAHALAEYKLHQALGQSAGRAPVSEYDSESMDAYTSAYVDYVQCLLREYQEEDGAAPLVFVEQRVKFDHTVPGGYGTCDCLIITGGTLHIVDLKYGVGVLVNAEHNPQLSLYALGALNLLDTLYDISTVRLSIYQPRRSHISMWETTPAQLGAWAENTVKPAARQAIKGEGEFHPGEWCQFCKLAPTCRARAEENMRLAELEFKAPAELTDSEVTQVLRQLPNLTRWASSVEKYALNMATTGHKWQRMKLVEGRATRRYTDETQVAQVAEAAGFTDVYDKKLIPITRMERLMGKQEFSRVLGGLVERSRGKPHLVPDEDPRPEATLSAEREFTRIFDKNTTTPEGN
ncbi:DUF2800 domain-containing protein [Schaalia radingae]|uniref:DUF2800 domain-containing protein n=1 Tax=Schaalia radingae TaxID=131110 RepID=A0ABY0V538_9ACTO|nr:DUF2800 domain-containing protein [Schaalia radingae]SDT85808.1 Protein of unknown function [Schaalia radingae]